MKLQWLILLIIFVLLAYKNPWLTNNLIANLEPYPDTLYYSNPAWNFVNGRGFEMTTNGVEISQIVPPLYGILLIPFFKFSGDVRSYYFLNMLLASVSIGLFLKLTLKLYKDSYLVLVLGLLLVTNFYFYNLPSLLMAENLLIPLTMAAVWLMLEKYSWKNYIFSVLVGCLLLLTKISGAPVVLVLVTVTLSKLDKNDFWKCFGVAVIVGLVMWFLVLAPNWKIYGGGNSSYSLSNIIDNSTIYFRQLMGNNGSYLWYHNAQIDKWVSYFSLMSFVLALLIIEFRKFALIILGVILTVVIFHSGQEYPEGRYISTIIPLLIMSMGIVVSRFRNQWFKKSIMLLMVVYFLLVRVEVNGFYERKLTTIKRQVLNNFRHENEVPWNFLAVENFNLYFDKPNKKQYLATLLPPFYLDYFTNGNYNHLPLSEHQEFSGKNKLYIESIYKTDGSLINLFERLMSEGNEVFVTNYYLNNHQSQWDIDYKILENKFALAQVSSGCMDLCKIYKLENKITNNQKTISPIGTSFGRKQIIITKNQ